MNFVGYVLIVIVTTVAPSNVGGLGMTQFQIQFPTNNACYQAKVAMESRMPNLQATCLSLADGLPSTGMR